jgi:hypothetical protein
MGTLVLLDLMGGIALLLWGLHIVQSGTIRAFGPDLRSPSLEGTPQPLRSVRCGSRVDRAAPKQHGDRSDDCFVCGKAWSGWCLHWRYPNKTPPAVSEPPRSGDEIKAFISCESPGQPGVRKNRERFGVML